LNVLANSWGVGASHTIKDVSFDASLDKGVLKTAEWLKFVSLFFNAEAKVRREACMCVRVVRMF
jgi:hypothetical protein